MRMQLPLRNRAEGKKETPVRLPPALYHLLLSRVPSQRPYLRWSMSTVFVHHRTSPFNQRAPNKGPDTLAHRVDFSHRQSSSPAPQGSTKPAAASRGGSRISQRTIAGNSRIPGHLDIYQDAVQKAFQDKARVSHPRRGSALFTYSLTRLTRETSKPTMNC